VVTALDIPVQVLIRPRPGDFHFEAAEIRQMIDAAAMCREAGARGIVIGALTAEGAIDRPVLRSIQAAGAPLPATMHRAFDEAADAERALEALVELGFERVLTSGQAPTALAGAHLLAELIRLADERLTIMPGGTVRAANAREILRVTGATELHARAEAIRELAAVLRPKAPRTRR
jgi:copper homeostasis protein